MKRTASITLISFTVAILAVSVVGVVMATPLPFFTITFPLKLFLLCLVSALLMRGYEALFTKVNIPFYLMIDIVLRLAIVLVMAFWFGPFIEAYEIKNATVLAFVALISCGTFIVTYIFSYRAFVEDIDAINRVIDLRRKRKRD